ncbi:porin [Loktanella sp. IMCC34160]|uniref:porin n=1 Tax=Loktanella sp. IMCC34160 TaxID=2510646 RepID=UPI00101D6FE7|nr:porin [Loktanella sp. IMCC34160]RYG91511.1 porin [Loktanella sp. IMCC34160]
MKSILLASASVIGLAGAAAAEVEFGGSATLGYNSHAYSSGATITTTNTYTYITSGGSTSTVTTTTTTSNGAGFYWDAALDVTLSQTLDNGLTVSASFGVDIADNNGGLDLEAGDYVISLTSDNAGLYFGDTDTAAGVNWAPGSALDGAYGDAFGSTDFSSSNDHGAVLRGEVTMAGVSAAVSYQVDADSTELSNLQFSAAAEFGMATVTMAYQDMDHTNMVDYTQITDEEIFGEALGLSVAATLGGADVNFGMLQVSDNVSGFENTAVGVGVSYPAGPVTLGAYYTTNSNAAVADAWGLSADYDSGNGITAGMTYDSDDSWEITAGYAAGAITVDAAFDSDDDFSLEGSYDVGNGLVVYAGLVDAGDSMYLGGEMDLGGGAALLVSYADDSGAESAFDDDIGARDYQVGTTVELTFEF